MKSDLIRLCGSLLLAGITAGALLPARAGAADQQGLPALTLQPTDPHEQGTLSPAARAAFMRRIPRTAADAAAKAAANRAYDEAVRAGTLRPATPGGLVAAGASPEAPAIVGGRSFAGLNDPGSSPPDTTGTIGPTRYIQTVNTKFGIYNRTSSTPLSTGTLNQLAGIASSVRTTDPEIIWDATTRRFYYVILALFSPTDNRLLLGFSKTASPASAADWCKYQFSGYGGTLPDQPHLGDSKDFWFFGVDVFQSATGPYLRSDILGISKPPAGTACPEAGAFKLRVQSGVTDAGGVAVTTPVPANQIDTSGTGYVVARGALPSSSIWLFKITKGADGFPVIPARGSAIPLPFSFTLPPDATQKGASQKLDTSNARFTQAVLARNPKRGNAFSVWTQHTVADGTVSAVRWYEVNPATRKLLTDGVIAASGTFFYNAAISPDRRVDGSTVAFGDSFVVQYNVSSALTGFDPRIVMGSSLHGGALSFALVKDAIGPYVDFTCPNPGNVCRWGDYAGAAPDPKPSTSSTGVVWSTNQFAGAPPSTSVSTWRTWIFAAHP